MSSPVQAEQHNPRARGTQPVEAAGQHGGASAVGLDDVFCPGCGYNLRGLSSARCPECGHAVDLSALREPQMPWVQRDRVRDFSGYWKTVWMVMFRNRKFCEEFNRPVSLRQAQIFRWLTLGRIYVPLLLITVLLYIFQPLDRFRNWLVDWSYDNIWPVAVMHLCLILFLVAASGLPTYFFQARDLPEKYRLRATALSYYTLAPLAWMPLVYAASFVLYWADSLIGVPLWYFKTITLTAMGLPIILVGWWYVELLRLASRTVRRDAGELFTMAIALPLILGSLAFLMLVVLPALVGYVVIMAASWN